MPDTHTRIRGARRDPPEPLGPPEPDRGPDPAPPPPLPDPGRHAAHRVVPSRFALGPAQLAVVAVVVALALAVACWWLVRSRASAPTPVAPLAGPAAPLSPASPASVAPSGAASAATGRVTVDVEGKVRRPGIVVLDAGSRVVDALKAAGGARPGADVSSLNLARVLVDGEQLMVGVPAPAGLPTPSSSGLPPASGSLVNLNTATESELEGLPEVGPVTAQAILAWRDQHGGFTSVNELLEVDGIGDATLQQLLPFVTV